MMQQGAVEHKPSPRDQRVAELSGIALSRGSLISDRYAMRVSATTPEVWVWQRGSEVEPLVAYSSMEADRLSSVEEFVTDYFA
jgi:hypothetical protein